MRKIFRLAAMLLLAAFAGANPSSAQTGDALKDISLQKDGRKLLVFLKIEGTFTAETTFLPSPPRLLIDLRPISGFQVPPFIPVNDCGVLEIRTGQSQPDTIRVVFDLDPLIPAHGILRTADGLRLSFGPEKEEDFLPVPVKDERPQPLEPAASSAPLKEKGGEPRGPQYFLALRAGGSLFLGPDLLVDKTFPMYGETAAVEEGYGSGISPAFEIQVGKYAGRIRFGLGVSFCLHNQSLRLTGELPHPFQMNAYRSVELIPETSIKSVWNFSAFALFPLMESGRIRLSAGPMLGLSKGVFQTLDDLVLGEQAPFSSADVTIVEIGYAESPYTELLFGGMLSLEWRLSGKLSLLGDMRILYANPVIASLGRRANLLQAQPVVGIRYDF